MMRKDLTSLTSHLGWIRSSHMNVNTCECVYIFICVWVGGRGGSWRCLCVRVGVMPTQVRVVVAHGDKDGGKTPKLTHTYTHTTSGRTRTCGGTLGQKVSAEPCCQHHWEVRQNTKVQKNHSMFSPRSSRTSPETTNAL